MKDARKPTARARVIQSQNMTLEQIENAVKDLPEKDLAAFRAWFAEFDAEQWDRQFERDVHAGRLDALADEALKDLDEGRCTDL